MSSNILSSHEQIVTLLAAIVKKYNNKIEITDKEMCEVTLQDCLVAKYNKKESKLIISLEHLTNTAKKSSSLN